MCSVQEDPNEETLIPIPEKTSLDRCKKCSSESCPIILRKSDAYCEKCFLINTTHKFRATLGKSRLIRPTDKVLIAYSGDQPSSILLHLVKDGLSESNFKKLRFEPLIIYIDEGAIFNLSDKERQENAEFIITSAEESGIDLLIAPFLDPDKCKTDKTLIIDQNADFEIRNMLLNTNSLTAKQDLFKKIRNKLLLQCARNLDCKFILTAETATKLAGTMLANVTLGGGGHIHSDVGFCDTRDPDVKILRPLRDFTSEDIHHFANLEKIQYINQKSLRDENNQYASIQTLTEKFVNDLQRDFPATISTIMRTGEKLEGSSGVEHEEICVLCESVLDTESSACSALEASDFSRNVSNCSSSDKSCSECKCRNVTLSREDIVKCLCYSCRLTVRDVKNVNILPTVIFDSALQRKMMVSIQDQLKDFLLEK